MEDYVISSEGVNISIFIQRVADLYFSAQQTIKTHHDDSEYIEAKNFIDKVKRAYEKLDYLERLFINNDFFYEQYPMWWMSYYSRSTYYRIRHRSMNNFKEAFECEN